MRPPQFAGEDPARHVAGQGLAGTSMRPPQFAGEDLGGGGRGEGQRPTSMRPPQFAGEDLDGILGNETRHWNFNEAPAVRGGRFACRTAPMVKDQILQ